jgi:hypothetical protein
VLQALRSALGPQHCITKLVSRLAESNLNLATRQRLEVRIIMYGTRTAAT